MSFDFFRFARSCFICNCEGDNLFRFEDVYVNDKHKHFVYFHERCLLRVYDAPINFPQKTVQTALAISRNYEQFVAQRNNERRRCQQLARTLTETVTLLESIKEILNFNEIEKNVINKQQEQVSKPRNNKFKKIFGD